MRVLFTVWPAAAHLYAAIPLAWAVQAAGHEVCFASHPELADRIRATGHAAVPLGTPQTVPALDAAEDYLPGEQEQARLSEAMAVGDRERHHPWPMFGVWLMTTMRMFHPVGGPAAGRRTGTDDLVDFARHWRPDLLLWDPAWPSAGVAARACRAAHARLLWGPDYWSWARERCAGRAAELAAAGVAEPLAEMVEPVARRHRVELDDELLSGQWTVDPTPAELRLPGGTGPVVPVRRVPFAGSGTVPGWLRARPERPRVALTLGTSARDYWSNQPMVAALLAAVGGLDAEVVATFNPVQLAGQAVPDNVRTLEYVPLTQLLPSCAAVIHHGGGGTVAAAVAHQVPQLIEVEDGVEAPVYGRYPADHGAGLTLSHKEHPIDELRERVQRVLTEPSFAAGAARLYADWLAMPSPAEIVPVLERLTAHHRGAR